MPARPMVLDAMASKFKGAAEISVATPQCCVGNQAGGGGGACKKAATAILSIRYNNGSTDVYILCRGHLEMMKEQHPVEIKREQKQGAFFYAGS